MTATRVDELERYGKGIDDMPKGLLARQGWALLSELRRRYGTWRFARMAAAITKERRAIRLAHSDVVAELRRDWGSGAVSEALGMAALFNVLTPIEGREGAYGIAQGIFRQIAPRSMTWLYQSDDLARCDGDRFENFKQFHFAMFDNSQQLFANVQTDEGDLFTTTVTKCANVEVFGALGCPELGRLGCDHDLAGYPAIADRHDVEFRRPTTIAKGGDVCRFRFYRKGTAPTTEEIDGTPATWTDALNE